MFGKRATNKRVDEIRQWDEQSHRHYISLAIVKRKKKKIRKLRANVSRKHLCYLTTILSIQPPIPHSSYS